VETGSIIITSYHGLAIEGVRKKSPLHDKLTDLGMQLRQLRIAVLFACAFDRLGASTPQSASSADRA
jgi:hypothetical protein